MSEFTHYCPQLSPNNTAPNMTASSCAARVKRKEGKCAKCPQGVGYVKPVRKDITERLWKNPKAEKPKKRIRKSRPVVERFCACGAKVEPCKTYCEDCRVKNLAVSLAKTRLKFLLKQRDKLNTQVSTIRRIITREI